MSDVLYPIEPTEVKIRIKLLDDTGVPITGLTNASVGLKISTIQDGRGVDGESSPAVNSEATGTIENITTLGVWEAPTEAGLVSCAALSARNYRSPGYPDVVDWYLPSKDELAELYAQSGLVGYWRYAAPPNDTEVYWSSSEISATHAWMLWDNGLMVNTQTKASDGYVRPIRTGTHTPAYVVGDLGPGGGKVFYVDGDTYYEASPIDTANKPDWSSGANQSIAVSGADGTALGTGLQNSIDIVNQAGNVTSGIRFKEVSATGMPGVYEIQFANKRMYLQGSAGSPMTLLLSVFGVATLAQKDFVIECINNWATQTSVDAIQSDVSTIISDIGNIPTAVDNREEMDDNSTKLANLDATVSSRLPTASYTAPLNATQTEDAVWDGLLPLHQGDFTTGKALNTAAAGGVSLTAQQVRDAMKLTPSGGAAASNSVDAKIDSQSGVINNILTIVEDTYNAVGGAISQLTGPAGSTPTLKQAIMRLYMKITNKEVATSLTTSTGVETVYDDNDVAVIKKSYSNSANTTTVTKETVI